MDLKRAVSSRFGLSYNRAVGPLIWLLLTLTATPAKSWAQLADGRRLLLAAPQRDPLPVVYRKPPRQPHLVAWELPYQEWQREYQAHFAALYDSGRVRFRPTSIIMHYTVINDAQAVWDSFARGCTMALGDRFHFGHPSVQLMIDKDGTIYRLLPLNHRGTGAYGADHVAISIEMVAADEKDLLSRPRQVFASFCLVSWLMKHYQIPPTRVSSHFEVSLGSIVYPEFTDRADPVWKYCYPPQSFRYDPGTRYMGMLRRYLIEYAGFRPGRR